MEYFAFILIFSTLAFANVVNSSGSVEKRLAFAAFVFLVALFTGLRGVVDEYTRLFVDAPLLQDFLSSSSYLILEKGYLFTLISSVIRTFGGSSQVLLLVFAFASIYIHATYFRKLTPYYFVAFLIYLSHEILLKEWFTVRAGFASALVLPCIYFLQHGKRGWFLFCVAVGGAVQYVGILSVFIYWLKREIKTSLLFWGLLISIVLALSGSVKVLLLYLADIGYVPGFVSLYFQSDAYGYKLGLSHPKIIQQLTLLLFALYFRSRMSNRIPYFNLVLNVYYLSTVSFILLSDIAIFAARIGGHFYSVEPVLIVYFAQYFVQKRFYLGMICIFSLAISYLNYIYRARLPGYEMFVAG